MLTIASWVTLKYWTNVLTCNMWQTAHASAFWLKSIFISCGFMKNMMLLESLEDKLAREPMLENLFL